MVYLAHLGSGAWSPEKEIGSLAILALAVVLVRAFIQWLLTSPVKPDPWDSEISAAVAERGATPLCHRCLSPNDPEADFCAECGAAIGQYTNWLPYPYIFSLGHTLRIGVAGEFKRSPLTILGYLLLPLAEYSVFAPFYWFVFLRHLPQGHSPKAPTEQEHQA